MWNTGREKPSGSIMFLNSFPSKVKRGVGVAGLDGGGQSILLAKRCMLKYKVSSGLKWGFMYQCGNVKPWHGHRERRLSGHPPTCLAGGGGVAPRR